MTNLVLQESITALFDECWGKVAKPQVGGADSYVYVAQVAQLLSDFAQRLPQKSTALLNLEEVSILSQMSENNPTLRVYHREFENFVLRLVRLTSMVEFISERTRLSPFELVRALQVARSSDGPEIGNGARGRILKTGDPIFRPKREARSPLPYRREYPTFKQERPITSGVDGSDEYRQSIRHLELRVKALLTYVDTLERQQTEMGRTRAGSAPSSSQMVRELLREISEKEKTIQRLETQGYSLNNVGSSFNEKLLFRMKEALQKQDTLVTSLKTKLELDQKATDASNAKMRSFLQRLPFIRQYYVYYKHQKGQNVKSIIVNVFTLLLATIIFTNVLRVVFYFAVYLASNSTPSMTYILEDVDEVLDRALFEWWREIEWLEYLIYMVNEWTG